MKSRTNNLYGSTTQISSVDTLSCINISPYPTNRSPPVSCNGFLHLIVRASSLPVEEGSSSNAPSYNRSRLPHPLHLEHALSVHGCSRRYLEHLHCRLSPVLRSRHPSLLHEQHPVSFQLLSLLPQRRSQVIRLAHPHLRSSPFWIHRLYQYWLPSSSLSYSPP